MSQKSKNSQSVDTQAMGEKHRTLCGALDRLLTIGSYYQPSHERFQAVAQECRDSLQLCVAGQEKVEIFINSSGLVIENGLLGSDEVEARRLFDLLDPMHIALLEIDADTTSDHLHLALASLKKARNSLTARQSYREIEIKGLPDTVRVINRSLFLKTQTQKQPKAAPKDKPEKREVTFFDHNLISDLLLKDNEQGQKLEKEFVGIIQGIMATADPTRLRNDDGEKADPESWLPQESINAIKGVLEALSGTGSDLMNLQHLIAQAQTALEMTGDPQLVDLVFSRLQKDSRDLARKRVQPKMIGKGDRSSRPGPKKNLIMSQDEMREIVDSLDIPYGPMPDPMDRAAGDCLQICVQIMDLAPTEELVSGIEETILRLITTDKLGGPQREAIITTLTAVLSGKTDETIDRLWPMIWGPLRRSHPDDLALLWHDLWLGLAGTHKEKAWPYLVNDLLEGLQCRDRMKSLMLLESLSKVQAFGNTDLRITLENLSALRDGTICNDFFRPPAPLLYPVHKVLIGCSFAPTFGPLLHENLLRQAPHKLSSVLLEIMDEYRPVNRAVYQVILDQGIDENLLPEMKEIAPEIIEETLADLHWDYMEEDWVAEAITWLGHLGGESALPIMDNILMEKKYAVLSGWPLSAREAAVEAREVLRERLEYKGRQDVAEENEEQPWTTPSAT